LISYKLSKLIINSPYAKIRINITKIIKLESKKKEDIYEQTILGTIHRLFAKFIFLQNSDRFIDIVRRRNKP